MTTVQEAGKKGGDTTAARYGQEFYEEIGKKGGSTTFKRYGSAFYQEIGRKGGGKIRDLVEAGRAAQQLAKELHDLDQDE